MRITVLFNDKATGKAKKINFLMDDEPDDVKAFNKGSQIVRKRWPWIHKEKKFTLEKNDD
jgi:hypothetical protein